jgi:Leucine-rich repeat (LRR) protein
MKLQELLDKKLAQLDGTKLIFSKDITGIKGKIFLSGNDLTEVDFSELEYLEDIDLSFNNLSFIDFKKVNNINSVLLNNNLLTKINFGEITAIDTLNISANPLVSLNYGKITEVGDVFLPETIKEAYTKDNNFKIKRNMIIGGSKYYKKEN